MNDQEFRERALRALVLADQLALLLGEPIDCYAGNLMLCEMRRYNHNNDPGSRYGAIIVDHMDSQSIFASGWGRTEEEAFQSLEYYLKVDAEIAEGRDIPIV